MSKEYHGLDVNEYFINLKESSINKKELKPLFIGAIKELQKWSMKKYGRKLTIKEMAKTLKISGSIDKDGNIPKKLDPDLTELLYFVEIAEAVKNE